MPRSPRPVRRALRTLAYAVLANVATHGDCDAIVLQSLVADPDRPYIYAVRVAEFGQQDTLLFIHSGTEQVEHRMPVGNYVTDLALHSAEGRLYLKNSQQPTARVIDLGSRAELPGVTVGIDVRRIEAGRAGRIYTESNNFLRSTRTADGHVTSMQSIHTGGGATDPSGSWYYHGESGISPARVTRFDIRGDTLVADRFSASRPSGSATVVVSGDGSRVFWGKSVHDSDLNELLALGSEIHATTRNGQIAISSNKVINANNGAVLAWLPSSSSKYAISGDEAKLFHADGSDAGYAATAMSSLIPVPSIATTPVPATGTRQMTPVTELKWTQVSTAMSYRVYAGPDSAAVSMATPETPLLVGEVTVPRITLPTPVPLSARLYWRVDAVGFSATTSGAVWTFDVVPILASPYDLTFAAIKGVPASAVPVVLTSETPQAWSVTKSASWLTLDKSSGSTPDTLWLSFDTYTLPWSTQRDTLRFVCGETGFLVPVTFRVAGTTLSQMIPDYERPYIYALHPGSDASGSDDAFVLFLNTDTDVVEKALPIGKRATSMALNRAEGRLFVGYSERYEAGVVDVVSQTALAPIPLETRALHVNAGRPGRIYVESSSNTPRLRVVDSQTGASIDSTVQTASGDAVIDPTGQWYYHSVHSGSTPRITRYDVTGDQPVAGPTSVSLSSPYGGLVISGDGSRLFWRGGVFDADLQLLRQLPHPIRSSSHHGEFAFGDEHVYDTSNGTLVTTLPLSTNLRAVSQDQTKLYSYHGDSRSIVVSPLGLTVLAVEAVELRRFALEGISPNPVLAARSLIRFSVSTRAPVRLALLDVQGRVVWRHQIPAPEQGPQSVPFDAAGLGAGVYFLRMHQGPLTASKRIVLAR